MLGSVPPRLGMRFDTRASTLRRRSSKASTSPVGPIDLLRLSELLTHSMLFMAQKLQGVPPSHFVLRRLQVSQADPELRRRLVPDAEPVAFVVEGELVLEVGAKDMLRGRSGR